MRNDISGTVGMDMAFDKVTFSIEGMDNLILDSVSGQAQSGMLLGVMGPSGSGKSTLINILCGRLRATSGSLLLDGVPVNWSEWREESLQKFQGLFGFIPQDDVVHPHLTVWENIMYSAKIRLGGTLKHREIENLVYQIILDLELEKVKNSVVGNEDRRGISGGERKRVSIALELVATPPVLLLDEPTSGLDSQAALSLIMLLKSLSRKGITVICVVHQPRIEIFEALDKVLLMGSGKTVYFGSQSLAVRHFRRMGYEFDPRLNPADIMMDIVFGTYAGKQSSIVKSFNDEDANSSMKAVAKRTSATGDETVNALMVQCHRYRQRYSPWYKQIYLAFCRDMTQQSRAAWSFILEIAGGTLCGLLLGLSVYEFRGHIYQGMFLEPFHVLSSAVDYTLLAQLGTLNCLATSFAAAAPSVIVFSAERRIFFRESFSGHSNFAYFGGKVLTTLLRSVISSLHFSTMFIILASPVISFGMLVGLNILYFYCVYGLGSIIAAITDHENGPLFCLLLNIVIAIFGGASPRLATVKSWHLEWFWYLCPGLWFCEAFFSAQVLPFSYLYNTEEAEAFTGYKFGRTGLDIGLLLVIGTLYRIIGCFLMILKARTRYGRSS
ncbi:putative ABC transporter [Talaromyces proteolyticus]|uniref:ABC transporter n=1 Tax=Talaromyces proteolyticus TaxID=1131652 RepID=A0AAD4Q680_9EURO|nr:putative ABC transporter [Talaromyces proteolyticus]KAH8705416.1 putative ABC transporter [Talaromyces proteolyticus]